MLIVTTNDLPGYQVTEVFGEIFGLTVVRSHPIASAIGSAFKAQAGGELKALTKHLNRQPPRGDRSHGCRG